MTAAGSSHGDDRGELRSAEGTARFQAVGAIRGALRPGCTPQEAMEALAALSLLGQLAEAAERADEYGALYCRNGHAIEITQATCECSGCGIRRALAAVRAGRAGA